jgi:hypothetical protein
MNFWNLDPVEGIGVHLGGERRNPKVWLLRFRDMLSPELYRRIRSNFFRLHYQFIMACDRRAPYDFFMLSCGPVAATEWARRQTEVVTEFSSDGTYTGAAAARAQRQHPQPAQ